MSKRERTWIIVVVAIILLALAWMTRYRYDSTTVGYVTTAVRTNRFTGSSEMYNPLTCEWFSIEKKNPEP